MSKQFKVPAKSRKNKFADNLSKGDAETFQFDFTPWQEDNNTITGVTWTVESGQAAISNETLASGVASALVTVAEAGKSLISITADTGTEKRVLWLEIYAKDYENAATDYGI